MTSADVIYNCPFVPAEWIKAHGLRPVRLNPRPSWGMHILGQIEGICPYALAFANHAAACDAGLVVFTTRCDQMRRVYELWKVCTGRPAFLLNLPTCRQSAAAQRFYIDELLRLGRYMEQFGGRRPTKPILAQIMLQANQDLETPVSPNRGAVPVAILGGPLMNTDMVLFDTLASGGAYVVFDGTQGGTRCIHRPFDRRELCEDPLQELALAYLDIPDVFFRPNDGLYRWLKAQIDDTAVRGLILHHYIWCDKWKAECWRIRQWLPIPTVVLSNDGQTGLDSPGIRNRLSAFLEAIR
ncbi:MAG: 2-hydroxyacyl-CoA dehydratase family protein [Sedimentisphaerales bacterium]|nr:2-hydroxyacyl-CoA dehydratase family protein [Sedimentisphaerales bacterium]